MSKDQFIADTENALEMFSGGHLVEAFKTLCDLGYDPIEAIDMMKTEDKALFEELNAEHNGQLAGVIQC